MATAIRIRRWRRRGYYWHCEQLIKAKSAIPYHWNGQKIQSKECLEVKKIKLRELNILGSKEEFNNHVNIKVRSTGGLLKAKINLLENFADVEILEKETGISPGQACVFYSKDDVGDKVLGGGWIHNTFNKNLST